MSEASATTRDAEIARNPHQPKGWRRDGIDFFVAPPPRCTLTSRRRRFANSTPSRSPQMSWYSWDEALASYSLALKGCFQLVASRPVELLQGLDALEINVGVILPGVTDTPE